MKWMFRLCLFAFALSCGTAYAQPSQGGYAESYLLRQTSARAAAMGGAYTAVANEPSALFYNVAGLAFTTDHAQASAMFTGMDMGREHNVLAYSQMFGIVGVGAGVNNYKAGSFIARNAAGESLGEYFNQQLAAQGGVALQFAPVSIGIAGKYLLNTLKGPNIRGDGWGIDVGTKFQLLDVLSIGIAAQNIAGEVKWNNNEATKEKLPYSIRAGIAAEFGLNQYTYKARTTVLGNERTITEQATAYALIAIEGSIRQFDNAPKFSLGVEIAPMEIIALRAGTVFYNENLTGDRWLNFHEYGFGVALIPSVPTWPFQFSLEYAAAHDLVAADSFQHHIALIVQF